MKIDTKTGTFWNADTFDAMREIPDDSVDMLLVDLPYGTTACKWDSVIPLESLWREYNRICKERAAMVFTAAQPFTTTLIASNIANFKYTWIWDKKSVTGFANAKKQPLRHLEDVVVFYRTFPVYRPQGLKTLNKVRKNSSTDGGATLKSEHISNGLGSLRTPGLERNQEFTNYPKQLLEFSRERGLHPTQKPVALFEYLIKTYTNEGDTVLDNTAGSGTTAVAACRTRRRWLCIERDPVYFGKAVQRVFTEETKL